MMELDTRLFRREAPPHPTPLCIAHRTPGGEFRIKGGHIGDAAAQAWLTQDAQRDLRYIEPTAVARRVRQFQAARQAVRLLGGKAS